MCVCVFSITLCNHFPAAIGKNRRREYLHIKRIVVFCFVLFFLFFVASQFPPKFQNFKQEKEEISPLSVLATPNFQWDLFSSLLLVREMFSLVFFLFALCNLRDARRLDVEKKCLFTKKEKKKNEAAAGLPPFGDSIAGKTNSMDVLRELGYAARRTRSRLTAGAIQVRFYGRRGRRYRYICIHFFNPVARRYICI